MTDFVRMTTEFERLAGYGKCYDVKKREFSIGRRRAFLFCCGCFSNDLMICELLAFFLGIPENEDPDEKSFLSRFCPCGDLSRADSLKSAAASMTRGSSVLLVDGFENALVADTKALPGRGIGEPETDRVLRGSRDGFVERLRDNTALLRMRISSPALRLEKYDIGTETKTSVVLAYIEGKADEKFVGKMRDKLENIRTPALSMGQESLAECLLHRSWWNPFPKFRYTERPDAAAAMILEGSVLIFVDNTPQVMLLPSAIFDFLQESDDFYFPPLIGSYLRLLRGLTFFLTLILTPLWYLLIRNPSWIPASLDFIRIEEEPGMPVFVQILLVEFLMDGLKLASLNTPSSLNSSLSIVAGLIIGDFAIEVGWLVPEVILYMAFVSTANFTQPSFELGYAFKFCRILLLILVGLFDLWGFVGGIVLFFVLIASNKTVDGSRSYLYPLLPFNGRAILRLLLRVKETKA